MARRPKDSAGQLNLFGEPAPQSAGAPDAVTKRAADAPQRTGRRRGAAREAPLSPIGPADGAAQYATLAARLPATLRLGTSSWSFPGWAGLVYDRASDERELAREGLQAYARHPLMRSVGIDRTYYAPIPDAEFARYAAATPADFRFLVKAPELCTLPRFGARNRYGRGPREPNEHFLDAAWALEHIVLPMQRGLREKVGVLVFQFPPLSLSAVGGPTRFAARLQAFLQALPADVPCAVEIRNAELLTRDYAGVLELTGAAHCFTVHPSMPLLPEQALIARPERFPHLVVRWMLNRRFEYEQASAHYAPFDRLVDENATERGAIAALAVEAAARHQEIYVIVNNKAEGSAPLSVVRLAEQISAHGAPRSARQT